MNVNDRVSISTETVTSGIYRIANLSACGTKAYLVSDARMMDKGWVNLAHLSRETSVENLAKEMGVSVNDLSGFVACLRVWMDKGYTMDEAIARHMQQMTRL